MSAPAVDWDQVTQQATDILSRYLAIDTTNPPGNEELAVRFLADLLRAEGIEDITVYDASDEESQGRLNLRARLPGDGSAGPLVLLSHSDVVPVERDGWEVEPFAGLVKDGVIWGRGALDMKGLGVMELIALLLMQRLGLPHRRDIVFLVVADEEEGSRYGIDFLERHHPEALEAEYVINEGGWGTTEAMGVRRPVFNCAASEKGPCWLRLVTEGPPGHGSAPRPDSALGRLVRVLNQLQDWERPRVIVPELREYLARAHRAGFIAEEPTDEAIGRMADGNPFIRALTSDTISLTSAHAGMKHNVIPAVAEATIDCRLVPGADAEAFIEEMRRVVDDPKVRIEKVFESSTPASPIQTELMEVIEDVVHEQVKEAVVLPSISSGFTDSRAFRRRGVTAYGFMPVLLEPLKAGTIHGHNERLSIENLRLGCRILFEVVRRICA